MSHGQWSITNNNGWSWCIAQDNWQQQRQMTSHNIPCPCCCGCSCCWRSFPTIKHWPLVIIYHHPSLQFTAWNTMVYLVDHDKASFSAIVPIWFIMIHWFKYLVTSIVVVNHRLHMTYRKLSFAISIIITIADNRLSSLGVVTDAYPQSSWSNDKHNW